MFYKIADVPLTYDIEKDSLYLKGIEKGDHDKARKVAEICLRKGYAPEGVAEIAGLPLNEVLGIAQRSWLL